MILIDVEASGLGRASYPIEIAWLDLESGVSDVFLINYETSLEAWLQWDSDAEAIHGVTRDQLLQEGVSVKSACRRLNSGLVGKVVFSDSPRQDLYWIRRLYDAAGLTNPKRCLFRINDLLDQIQSEDRPGFIADSGELERPHRALADCKVIAGLIAKWCC